MKISCVMWNSRMPTFARAAADIEGVELDLLSTNTIEDLDVQDEFFARAEQQADALLLYHTQGPAWAEMEPRVRELGKSRPVVAIGRSPDDWALSNQPVPLLARLQEYLTLDGDDNVRSLLLLLAKELGGMDVEIPPPVQTAWDGIHEPEEPRVFATLADYLPWAKQNGVYRDGRITVGVLFYRSVWVAQNTAYVDAIVEELRRRDCNVIPIFSLGSFTDRGSNARPPTVLFDDCFYLDGEAVLDVMLNLQAFFLGHKDLPGVEILKTLGVPVLSGSVAYRRTEEEWLANPTGISRNVSMLVSGPEFDGVIEPLVVAAIDQSQEGGAEVDQYVPIPERIQHAAARLLRWAELGRRKPAERKVAFIFHNNPCAAVEATVGGAAKLDSLESVVRVLRRMKEAGYEVEVPESGQALIDTIMDRKATSEFRWTSTAEIVAKGGVLDRVDVDRYRQWFDEFPGEVRERLCESWGNPPGEEKDGIPAAMVHEGTILITGLRLGNAAICIQPKRGCAGARCDGQVCKILHDPTVPPTHQYLATYRWLEDVFGADCIVHVGTHGNLEFLPGKSIGLSNRCYPDVCLGTLPHLYIYNSDNPPEGVIAKRRGLATLVDHMQTVMTDAGTYEEVEEIERLLGEYAKASVEDRARAHQLQHQILELVKAARLDEELDLPDGHADFEEVAKLIHECIFRLKNSRLAKGMHILGELPEGDDRVEFLYSILRHADSTAESFRARLATHLGHDLETVLGAQGAVDAASRGRALDHIDRLGRRFVALSLDSLEAETAEEKSMLEALSDFVPRVREIDGRLEASHEIEALLGGFAARYIPSGPSSLITRGRDDVLPTGRNFYSLDPNSVPTKAAFAVGKELAHALVTKYAEENSRLPEHVAIYWMANDIMWSDGEGMGQILDLLGCEPVWNAGGRVQGFRVTPAEELPRPRIDVTVRVSGITRDNFPNCMVLVDEAIQAVAALDEPPDLNFLRKHVSESLQEAGQSPDDAQAMREATYRVFSAQPGSYRAGVQLAVYASAWKDIEDLGDVFLYWNGYAYGKDTYGVAAHRQLRDNLRTVEVTYNKTATDESDLFGCCCYFGTHGGMTAAVRSASGKDVPAYYGDTREPLAVEVRTLEDEVRRVVRAKILNPKWIESMKEHGYKGAGDISKRVGRVYGWEAAANAVDDWIFDEITDTFVLDPENRQWFEEKNKWALEEISRRMLEAHERDLWQTSEDRLQQLRESYLEIESWMEEDMGENMGDVQGGAIDILTAADVQGWSERLQTVLGDVRAVAKEDAQSVMRDMPYASRITSRAALSPICFGTRSNVRHCDRPSAIVDDVENAKMPDPYPVTFTCCKLAAPMWSWVVSQRLNGRRDPSPCVLGNPPKVLLNTRIGLEPIRFAAHPVVPSTFRRCTICAKGIASSGWSCASSNVMES